MPSDQPQLLVIPAGDGCQATSCARHRLPGPLFACRHILAVSPFSAGRNARGAP